MSEQNQPLPVRTVIMGAAGRDFHNFNVVYRHDPLTRVVAFTAAQIPHIDGRLYPPALAGPDYPHGIPIVEESSLEQLCREERVERVVFAYSDASYDHVMHQSSRALAAGADFVLLGPGRTSLRVSVPAIAISAVRTGCGKSQTTRWVCRLLKHRGLRVAAIRHPMPYGDLGKQSVQRFETREDLGRAACTIEEREEYEPLIASGTVVFAGVDYEPIFERAASEAEIIVWDGGNNDFPFVSPDLHVVLVDPLRPEHTATHYPGEAVLRTADVIVVAKTDGASAADIGRVVHDAREVNPRAQVIHAASPVTLDDPDAVRGRRVIVVDDGPTLTHGGMAYGAAYVAALRAGVAEIVDPRPFAAPEIEDVYRQYPHLGAVLPAVGYYPEQLEALRDTIESTDAELVVSGTPTDLSALIELSKPVIRARYEFAEVAEPGLRGIVEAFLERAGLVR
jgi:predicted GTPase